MREKPRGHYIDEAEHLALLVRKYRDRFSPAQLAIASSILFWAGADPDVIRQTPALCEALEKIHDAAEAMEMLA